MTSDYRYEHILGDAERQRISYLLLTNKKPINYISSKFGLSKRFLTHLYIDLQKTTRTDLGSKTEPYYTDEMDYGRTPEYKWSELSANEIKDYI